MLLLLIFVIINILTMGSNAQEVSQQCKQDVEYFYSSLANSEDFWAVKSKPMF